MTAIFLVFFAGILLATYALILSFLVKKCHYPWENIWFIYTVVGLFIYPWCMALTFIPVKTVLSLISAGVIFRAIVFGFLFGLGNTLFGFVVPIIGVSTASAINPSIVLSIGAIMPIVLTDISMFIEPQGILVLSCVFILLLSLVVTYLASLRREREQANFNSVNQSFKPPISFRLGLILCIFSGLFAAQQNIGFYLSNDIHGIVELQSVPSYANGYLVWALSMTGTTLASLSVSIFFLYKNKSILAFFQPQKYLDHNPLNRGNEVKLPKNPKATLIVMASLMGVCQTSAFILYGMGADFLGEIGPSVGFAIFCGTSILTNQIIGFIQGDWASTSNKTRSLICLSIFLIIFSIITLAFNSM